MSSFVYNSCLDDEARGSVNFASDDFYVLLCTSAYVPSKDGHTKRSDIAGEVTGAGYTAGGQSIGVVVVKDLVHDRINIGLGSAAWADATITARYAVYYKRRGGAAWFDELLAVIDFEGDVVSTNGSFSLTESTIRVQN